MALKRHMTSDWGPITMEIGMLIEANPRPKTLKGEVLLGQNLPSNHEIRRHYGRPALNPIM
ncbi:MAG: hypothetical protein AM324_009465 [Candidatus Thorarchaeota archaeon SMTZ1-83]